MFISVVGTDDAVEEVLMQLAGAVRDVRARGEEGAQQPQQQRGFVGTVDFDNGEEVQVEVGVTTADSFEQCVADVPKSADAVVFAIDVEEDAQHIAARRGGAKQPFAVVAGEACTEETVADYVDKERLFLGAFSATEDDTHSLLWTLHYASSYPSHVLWDRIEGNFTAVGWRALQRLFWWHDKDLDDELCPAELLTLLRAIRGAEQTAADVQATVALVKEQQEELCIDNFLAASGNVTHYAWMALCEGWLSDTDSELYWETLRGLWQALRESGVGANGQPWTAEDLRSVRIDTRTDMLQLSYTGAQLLRSVYEERFGSVSGLWRFTPSTQYSSAGEPPWADVHGLPGSREEPQEYSCENFIASWRFMAVRKYQYLIVFCRAWGFKDDPNVLFVKKKRREYRESVVDLPNILQCLVLGSPRCGKTCLRKRLADVVSTSDDQYAETKEHSITLVPQKSGEEKEKFDLVLHELPDKDVTALLAQPSFMSHIDAVLMCYDGDDAYSFSYIAEKYPIINSTKIPMLLVMTKVDLLGDELCNLHDQEYHIQPNEFARQHGLCWPPALVSCYLSASQREINDVNDLPISVSMLCRYPDEHIGKEESSLCWKACKMTTCTAMTIGAIAGIATAGRRYIGAQEQS